LVLHDLHPDSLEQRVIRAIDSVAPRLLKGGATVEVTSLDTQTAAVTVTVTTPGSGCGSTAQALCDTVRQALDDAAPDATIDVTLAVDTTPTPMPVRLGRKPVGAAQGP
jgi:Fe-S cluster biogenesis protein NfuA